MGGAQYVVAAPLAVILDTAGSYQYVYQGGPVVFDVDPDHLESLVAKGVLVEADAPVVVAGDPADAAPELPAKSAKADVWEAYGLAQGLDPALVKKATKKQLVAHFYDGEPLVDADPETDPEDEVDADVVVAEDGEVAVDEDGDPVDGDVVDDPATD